MENIPQHGCARQEIIRTTSGKPGGRQSTTIAVPYDGITRRVRTPDAADGDREERHHDQTKPFRYGTADGTQPVRDRSVHVRPPLHRGHRRGWRFVPVRHHGVRRRADAYADTYSSTVVASASTTTSGTIPAGQLSVVNFHPKWGDKQSNKTAMLKYIEEAHQEGVKMIVFPEMALTGYVSSSDPESDAYRMAVSQAETTESPVTRELAEAAERNGMWVIYGTPEKIPGDTGHAYNSAFAISPDGKVSAYQKIAPVEGSWATPAARPSSYRPNGE